MASNYRTPGAYIEEVSNFPPSVVPVETAIPAFIGYTRNIQYKGENLVNQPKKITSLLQFEQVFGLAPDIGGFAVTVDADGNVLSGVQDPPSMAGAAGLNARFRLHYALRHYFLNGGGPCYVVSIGPYADRTSAQMVTDHNAGLAGVGLEDEPTLIVMPDLSAMAPADPTDPDQVTATRANYHSVLVQGLAQCAELGDRFLIGEIWRGDRPGQAEVNAFRDGIGTANLKYGAVYHPYLRTTIGWRWQESNITVSQLAFRAADGSISPPPSPHNGLNLLELKEGPNANPAMYARIRAALDLRSVILPPGPAIAGVYAAVDRTRGVWKAPGNVSLASVGGLSVDIDKDLNDHLNVHPSGKSINALRSFTGKGFMVWGARTLAGNDNEWRYVSVRRFFNMVEESTKKASYPFVFEANDANTWTKVQGMIENFLVNQWRAGALVGAKPEDAFYVRVGLGTTMTAQDVLGGRMNVEIGMAVVRPAEFIVLRFSHILPEA
jgi:uncharacterized protein